MCGVLIASVTAFFFVGSQLCGANLFLFQKVIHVCRRSISESVLGKI